MHFLLFVCTIIEKENGPLKTENKGSFSLEKIIIGDFTKIRDGRLTQNLDLFGSGV